jgi:hypothetical protein
VRGNGPTVIRNILDGVDGEKRENGEEAGGQVIINICKNRSYHRTFFFSVVFYFLSVLTQDLEAEHLRATYLNIFD